MRHKIFGYLGNAFLALIFLWIVEALYVSYISKGFLSDRERHIQIASDLGLDVNIPSQEWNTPERRCKKIDFGLGYFGWACFPNKRENSFYSTPRGWIEFEYLHPQGYLHFFDERFYLQNFKGKLLLYARADGSLYDAEQNLLRLWLKFY